MTDDYTTVSFRNDGLNMPERLTRISDAMNWCRDNFGPRLVIPLESERWTNDFEVFRFRDPRDATLFLLRWS